MKPYALSLVRPEVLATFERIKKAIMAMPDVDLGIDEQGEKILLSCHVLARAITHLFPVRICDGFFCGNYQHSWVETNTGELIDVYPVGIIGGPIMFDLSMGSPQRLRKLYKKCRFTKLFGLDPTGPVFKNQVKIVIDALKPHIE